MEDRIKIPECCDERFSGIREKVTYIFKADRGIDMIKDTAVYTFENPRAYLDNSLFYKDRQPNYKGSSTKSGNSIKAIKARRKKNKNKKTHRR